MCNKSDAFSNRYSLREDEAILPVIGANNREEQAQVAQRSECCASTAFFAGGAGPSRSLL